MSAVVASSSRALLRQHAVVARSSARQQVRRYADSTADKAKQGAEKAKDAASNATSKASEGLSRVTSTAGPALSRAASGVGSALSRIGGRTGKLIGFVESMIPPTIYYSKVGLELSKLIFQGQKMTPPSFQQFQSYLTPLLRRLSNPTGAVNSTVNSAAASVESGAASPEALLQRLRNMDQATLVRGGVLFAEVLGFFTVGEMLGRLKIVGYRGEVHHEH